MPAAEKVDTAGHALFAGTALPPFHTGLRSPALPGCGLRLPLLPGSHEKQGAAAPCL